MDIDELAKIKAGLFELNRREEPARRHTIRPDHRPAPERAELAELESLLTADQSFENVSEILARRNDERHKAQVALQEHLRGEAQKTQAVGEASLAAAVAARGHALKLLAQPFTSSFVTLDEPFLIWELPHPNLDIFRDSSIEPFASWIEILLDTRSSGPSGQNTDFRFYFLWDNPSDYYAIANASSSLALNGQAVAWGSPGVLHGDTASLHVTAYLSAIRWSGWGTDPVTGQSLDQTPYPVYDYQSANKSVVAFDAYGGDWFDSVEPGSATFDPSMPYELMARLIAIPGRAVTLFEVGLNISWWFHDGIDTVENDDQIVTLDLAYDPLGHIARCPMVSLEILTPPV